MSSLSLDNELVFSISNKIPGIISMKVDFIVMMTVFIATKSFLSEKYENLQQSIKNVKHY